MQKTLVLKLTMLAVAGVLFGSFLGGAATAAEQEKKAKKPKAAKEAKAAKPKGEKPKFQTAETAGKATACFGTAPKIEQIAPDEGKAGDKVTITGKNFGAAQCLRTVSFGPGHEAKFQYQNDTSITTTVPSGGRKGLVILTVTTASGEDSKPFLVK
jgi:hypothetical protein